MMQRNPEMYARYGTPPTMTPLAPAPPTDAQKLERLRRLYPIYCSHLDVPTLQLILECLGDTMATEEVKKSFNRIMTKQIPGLNAAAQAICLFCVFETISQGAKAIPNLLERLRMQMTGLEVRWDYMPRHYMLTNDVYNHVYGLFASCIVADEALSPADLALIYRYAEKKEDEDKIFQAFEDWMGQSVVLKTHGQHSASKRTMRDTVGMWLGGAIRPQPHVLLLVMLAIEKLGGYISVADFMVNFGMKIDYDDKKLPLMNPSAPGTIVKQQVDGSGEASAQPAKAPRFLPWPRFVPLQVQQQAQVPSQRRELSTPYLNNRVDVLRRSSAPQPGTSGTLDLQSPAALQVLISQGEALRQLGSAPQSTIPFPSQGSGQESQDSMAASRQTFKTKTETEQRPAEQEQTETRPSQQMAPRRPAPRKGPVSSTPVSREKSIASSASSSKPSTSKQQTPKLEARTSSRRRKSRGFKIEPLSDDEDAEKIGSSGVRIPDDDPQDGDFTG